MNNCDYKIDTLNENGVTWDNDLHREISDHIELLDKVRIKNPKLTKSVNYLKQKYFETERMKLMANDVFNILDTNPTVENLEKIILKYI